MANLIFDKMLSEQGLTICPYSIRHIIRMCCLRGNYLIASGSEANLLFPSPSLDGAGVVSSEGREVVVRQQSQGNSWQVSCTYCVPASRGRLRHKTIAPVRPCRLLSTLDKGKSLQEDVASCPLPARLFVGENVRFRDRLYIQKMIMGSVIM